MQKNKKIIETCSALNLIFIENFFYLRIIKGKYFFILGNDNEIINFIEKTRKIGKFIERVAIETVIGKLSFNLYEKNHADFIERKMFFKKNNTGAVISICTSEYTDIFLFFSSVKSNSFYLNNFNLLKRFIVYFRQKHKNTIDNHYKNPRILFKRIPFDFKYDTSYENLKNFKNQISPHKTIIHDDTRKIILTPREIKFLFFMIEGKSINKIAKELKISSRTAEACLENIKIKTGYATKAKLLANFFEQKIYFPSIHYDRYS